MSRPQNGATRPMPTAASHWSISGRKFFSPASGRLTLPENSPRGPLEQIGRQIAGGSKVSAAARKAAGPGAASSIPWPVNTSAMRRGAQAGYAARGSARRPQSSFRRLATLRGSNEGAVIHRFFVKSGPGQENSNVRPKQASTSRQSRPAARIQPRQKRWRRQVAGLIDVASILYRRLWCSSPSPSRRP